ncbi:unnamed protein product [Alternaria alternata]
METTASIIAVTQLCEKVIKYIIAVSGAKDEKARLRSKIRGCSSLLLQLQDEAADSEEVEEWTKTLELLSAPLARLHEALSLTAVALSSRDGVREKLQWPFKEKDVGMLVEAIDSEMAMLSLALDGNTTRLLIETNARSKRNEQDLKELKGTLKLDMGTTISTLESLGGDLQKLQITQNGVRGGVDKLHERHDMKEAMEQRENILKWLTPIDHASQQRDTISRRQAGTGGWLLRSQVYQDWLGTSNRTLFCPGIPGAGKTVSASIINADLWERYGRDNTIGLAHLFCNYRRQDEQTLDALLSGLLRQLVEPQASLPKHVEEFYVSQKGSSDKIEATAKTLQLVASTYSRVFIVIDALDECSASHGCRIALLSRIQELQNTCGINLLVTSRFIPEIVEKFKTASMIEIQADRDDVRRYLSENMSRLPGFVRNKAELQEEIISRIVEAVRGMFLLAKLHLDSLLGKRSPKAVRIALDKLPTGTDAYDSAYDSAMERIEGQMAEQTELAKQALAFLTCAREPLSTMELQEAMCVEIDEPEMDPDNYPDVKDIIASCLGLVTVDDDRSIIRLVHYTTQEYLERTLDRWFPAAEAMIADVCLSYLCLNRYSDPAYLDPTKDGTWYDYAARNWLHHARRAPSSLKRVVDFLTQETPLIRSYISWRVPIFTLEHIKELWITGLHFAAEYDLEDVIAPLLQRGSDLSRRDVYGQTPLLVAARKGRKAAAEQLLRHGSSIDERLDKGNGAQTGFTALHLASENGHVPIVRLLLEAGAAINSQGENDHTPLSIAVFRGRTEVVQVLLDAGADMTLHNTGKLESNSLTLLGLASFRGHADIVQLLIAAGVDVNERYEDDFAIALWDSASRQRTDCIRILLEAGADPNLTGGTWENSPLIMVCLKHIKDCKDCVDIVKMLLDAGADIDHINLEGWTAYGFAKMKQNLCVAEYLLERGANPELGLNGQPDSPHSQ